MPGIKVDAAQAVAGARRDVPEDWTTARALRGVSQIAASNGGAVIDIGKDMPSYNCITPRQALARYAALAQKRASCHRGAGSADVMATIHRDVEQ